MKVIDSKLEIIEGEDLAIAKDLEEEDKDLEDLLDQRPGDPCKK